MFQDRAAAGEKLVGAIREAGLEVDVVLAVPRGGLPVGRVVADAFDVPLDIVAAKKLGAPGNPELAIGAAAADGSLWVNDGLVSQLGVTDAYLESERQTAMETARQKETTYRSGRDPATIEDRRVAVVDDGVATGATMFACLEAVGNQDPASLVVGVPVGPPETLSKLEERADAVIAVERPAHFTAVGGFYREFDQVSDEAAMASLER